MDKPAAMHWTPIVQRLFQSIEDKARMCGAADPPANDASGEGIDDKCYIDKTLPRRHVGEILSANSGGLCQGGETCHSRFGAWRPSQPVHNT